MASWHAVPEYAFFTHWRFRATAQEVYDVLADPIGLARWWPSVYLDVKELKPAAPDGSGRVIGLFTKGFLPYTLKWNFTVTESTPPTGFKLVAHGDFEGTGVWTLGSFALRPFFAANHRWAMARGQESLELELRRRRGEKDVPAPPGVTFR